MTVFCLVAGFLAGISFTLFVDGRWSGLWGVREFMKNNVGVPAVGSFNVKHSPETYRHRAQVQLDIVIGGELLDTYLSTAQAEELARLLTRKS